MRGKSLSKERVKMSRNLSAAHEDTRSNVSSYKDRRYKMRRGDHQSFDHG